MGSSPTIRDVAREAGVAPATVSLALRNHPRLKRETCRKVQRVAKKLGYRPNAVVAQLLAQLRASRTPKYQATLGLINASENPRILGEIRTFREWTRGCRERASQLGYGVDDFWLYEKETLPARFVQILRARNIRGVIVTACLGDGSLPAGFDEIWTGFACVVLGVRVVRPALHSVCNDQFSTVRQAFDEAMRLKYKRPALVISENVDNIVEGRFSGGFLVSQNKLPPAQRVPPFFFRSQLDVPIETKVGTGEVLAQFGAWFKQYTPDVILCIHPETRRWVESLGARVPRDVGLIHLDLNEQCAGWAGMNQNSWLIGAAGVDLLVGQLHRNELGVPSFPKCMLIQSIWVKGGTVREQRVAKVPAR